MNFKDYLPKSIPLLNQKSVSESFFALDISPSRVYAALWQIEGRELKIINTSTVAYKDQHALLESANRALDEALADYPDDPKKVLFGVPDYWLQDDNLKDEYLTILRHLTKELDLTPLAYVSASHAVSYFLQKQTGVPISAILVNNSDPLIISVVKTGKILGYREVKRGDDLAVDIQKGLVMFDELEVLPSRILLFGQESAEGVKEKLVSFPWMSKLPFLHLPKIDLLDRTLSIQSVCFAGASEINPEVSYRPEKLTETKASQHLAKALPPEKLPVVDEVETAHGEEMETMEDAGFIKGDIEESNIEPTDEMMSLDDPMPGQVPELELVSDEFDEEFQDPARQEVASVERYASDPVVAKHHHAAKGVDVRSFLAGKWMLLVIPLVVLLAGVIAYMSMVKANVSVFIDAKVMENESQVIADPGVSVVDEVNKKIPGKIVEATVGDTAKGVATGKKQIGDPAKGKVVIYNKTDSQKTFSQGTILTGSGGLKFKLDTTVSVASKSSTAGPDFSEVIKPGQSEAVGITAAAVGPEGNLPAQTNLSVTGFEQNQVIASVDTALSGGTSKDITVVTADDQKRLLAQLTSDLRKRAQTELQGRLSGDARVPEEGLQETVTRQSYSKNVGDQASEFSLTASVNYKGTSYSDTDLKTMVGKTVQLTVPDGYEINLADTETQAAASKVEKDGKLIFTAKFKAKLRPKVVIEDYQGKIAGKSVDEAESILRQIENVIGVSIDFEPTWTSFVGRLPFNKANINLEVTAK